MNEDCLKLTTYFGERHRIEDQFVADALLDLYGRREVEVSVMLRGAEGFGHHHHLRTDRLLTLSEDLPLVSVAVDTRARIDSLLDEVVAIKRGGLITLERARMLTGEILPTALPEELHDAMKLTIYVGREERTYGVPAYIAVCDLLHRRGVAGATVLLGVDGMAHRRRRRARFFSCNERVPLMIVSIGAGDAITAALPGLDDLLDDPILTLERVRVCKRDGELLAEPLHLPQRDATGLGLWQKLMVFAGEQARHGGHPLYIELIRRLRERGASGATSLRGVWGFSGDHAPHGDRLFRVRRRVPVVTTIVDTPEEIRRWFAIVDECTDEAGLVTSEIVPAFHAVAPERRVGGLRLARPHVPR